MIDSGKAKEQSRNDLLAGAERPWREISKETYEWLRDCVPPEVMTSYGFVNSEPYIAARDATYYATCRNTVPAPGVCKYWYRLSTVDEYLAANALAAPLPPVPVEDFADRFS